LNHVSHAGTSRPAESRRFAILPIPLVTIVRNPPPTSWPNSVRPAPAPRYNPHSPDQDREGKFGMRTVTLTETGQADFYEGDDGAFYTPVVGLEARCEWCARWGHHAGLYHRQVLYTERASLVCGRHVRRDDQWRGAV
jgi:hypothetical protein